MEQTFEQRMDNVKQNKKTKKTINLNIGYCPMNLYEKFVSNIHLYNDSYWAKLQDLLRKEEMYDYLIDTGFVKHEKEEQTFEPEEINKKEEDKPMTIGDIKKAREQLEKD